MLDLGYSKKLNRDLQSSNIDSLKQDYDAIKQYADKVAQYDNRSKMLQVYNEMSGGQLLGEQSSPKNANLTLDDVADAPYDAMEDIEEYISELK